MDNKTNSDLTKVQEKPFTESPLAIIFYVMAVLSILGGFILSDSYWPKDLQKLNNLNYLVPASIIVVSIVQSFIFLAIGKVLSYLRQIMINTSKK